MPIAATRQPIIPIGRFIGVFVTCALMYFDPAQTIQYFVTTHMLHLLCFMY
jgi:hypothetical protein